MTVTLLDLDGVEKPLDGETLFEPVSIVVTFGPESVTRSADADAADADDVDVTL